jgi:ferredoxin
MTDVGTEVLLVEEARERLQEHVEHKLGFDPGCGQCMYCHTCGVRICSGDLFVWLVDQGVVRHARFGNAGG